MTKQTKFKIMELELKHLAAYLPYGLNILYWNGTAKEYIEILQVLHYETRHVLGSDKHKPILRPLSDLIKEITVNGETFVPLVKLLDITTDVEWSKSKYIECDSGQKEFWCYLKNRNKTFIFGYNSERNYFYSHNHSGNNESVKNQITMFYKLLEWHFDIFELIPARLAIDRNTLNE